MGDVARPVCIEGVHRGRSGGRGGWKAMYGPRVPWGVGDARTVRSSGRAPGQKPAVIEVNCQSVWLVPLHDSFTPPPGQGRSRLTDQKARRARPLALA